MVIKTTEDFVKQFDFNSVPEYYSITKLIDTKIGFSVLRNYPQKFKFYPFKKKDGSDDAVALIHIFFQSQRENGNNSNNKVAIGVRISLHSIYRNNHFDYNFDDPDCPTKESIEQSKKTPKPIDLENITDYFFDQGANKFIGYKNVEMNGLDILNEIYLKHLDTIHLLKGFKIRFKLKTKSLFTSFLRMKINFLINILKIGFGRTLDEKRNTTSILTGFKKEDFKKLTTDTISIFNYKASKSVIVVFCLLIVTLGSLNFILDIKNSYLSYVFKNQLITLAHSIILLTLLDVVVPWVLFYFLNMLIKIRSKLIFRKLKL